ncbi:MAG: hypothetical protein AAF614_32175, partial [Chloroflexota bacterium]
MALLSVGCSNLLNAAQEGDLPSGETGGEVVVEVAPEVVEPEVAEPEAAVVVAQWTSSCVQKERTCRLRGSTLLGL